MDLITIIIPVYNVSAYLEKCIRSVTYQTYRNIEVILVDDGSTDDSGLICDKWEQRDERIKVIHKRNGGLSEARNYGIENSSGNYLMFVDSDDAIAPQMVQILLENIIKYDADIAFCNYGIDERILKHYFDNQFSILEMSKMEALADLYGENHIRTVIACGKLYKRELFSFIRFEVGRIHEDESIMYKLFDASKKIVYVDVSLYYYYQRENSISKSEKSVKNLDYLVALEERIAYFKEKEYYELYLKTIETYLDMNIYYSTFIAGLPAGEKDGLLNDFKRYYLLVYDRKIVFYKKVLWFFYNHFSGMVQIMLKVVKRVFFSKNEFKYE